MRWMEIDENELVCVKVMASIENRMLEKREKNKKK
jgi:hypothetical protein